VLQIHGNKKWKIWNRAFNYPLKGDTYKDGVPDDDELLHEVILRQGDCLYLPRGFVHTAVTENQQASFHLTLGVIAKTWRDVLEGMLSEASGRHSQFRTSLPLGYVPGQSETKDKEVERTIMELVKILGSEEIMSLGIKRIGENFVQNQSPFLLGHILDLEKIDRLSPDSQLSIRDGIIYRISSSDDGVSLRFHGKLILLPQVASSALDVICKRKRILIKELDDCFDAESSMVLAKRLVKEGFLAIDS
jgi:ribosomal protein L16 Arg81 hydroxylase